MKRGKTGNRGHRPEGERGGNPREELHGKCRHFAEQTLDNSEALWPQRLPSLIKKGWAPPSIDS